MTPFDLVRIFADEGPQAAADQWALFKGALEERVLSLREKLDLHVLATVFSADDGTLDLLRLENLVEHIQCAELSDETKVTHLLFASSLAIDFKVNGLIMRGASIKGLDWPLADIFSKLSPNFRQRADLIRPILLKAGDTASHRD